MSRYRLAALVILGWMLIAGAVPTALAQKPQDKIDPELQQQINAAIDKGVAYLKGFDWARTRNNPLARPGRDPEWTGAVALGAWTLLESGVKADDPTLAAMIDHVRTECVDLGYTYSIALVNILLEKLGDPGDFPLIESLTLRLIHGQNRYGGWDYICPYPDRDEQARLLQIVQTMKQKRAKGEVIPRPEKLSPEIVAQLQKVVVRPPAIFSEKPGDNSNTQFAMMGLWVARRHGLPVHRALALVEERFRTFSDLQNPGWGYGLGAGNPKMGMTCAGLLALALGQGNANKGDLKKLMEDPLVKNSLETFGQSIAAGRPIPHEHETNIAYFLFSLERMAVVYDVKKIGDWEWYTEGAKYLVKQQKPGGFWLGAYTKFGADTCFALLFLKRANVAQDLTDSLQGLKQAVPKAPSTPFNPDELLKLPTAIPKTNPKQGSSLAPRLVPRALSSPPGFLPCAALQRGAIPVARLDGQNHLNAAAV